MKKVYLFLVVLCTFLMICGCTARGGQNQAETIDASSAKSSQSSEDSEPALNESETRSGASESVSEADAPASALAGKYVFHTEGVEDIYCPNVVLREDGTCRFNVNLLTNMGAINGTYTLEKEVLLTIEVDNLSFDGFTGDDTKRVYFEIAGDDTLMYRGTDKGEDAVIGMTNPMDLFKKEA